MGRIQHGRYRPGHQGRRCSQASLYDCFGSKEELVRSYLSQKHAARSARITEGLKKFSTPQSRLLGVFDILNDSIQHPGFRGCAVTKAGLEAPDDSSIRALCENSRIWLRDLFVDLAAEAGAADPKTLGRQLSMLYDGAAVAAQLDGNKSAAADARQAAKALLDVSAVKAGTAERRSRRA